MLLQLMRGVRIKRDVQVSPSTRSKPCTGEVVRIAESSSALTTASATGELQSWRARLTGYTASGVVEQPTGVPPA